MRRVGLFAGTFDPVTLGHLDVVHRALGLFDRLIVAVAAKHHKQTLFTGDERVAMITDSLPNADLARVQVMVFEGLLVDLAKKVDAQAVVRGMRFVSDFEYELQMAQMNRKLYPKMETIFLTPSEQFSSLNSTLVKEIALNGGPVRGLVSKPVAKQLAAKYRERKKALREQASRSDGAEGAR